MSWLYAAETHVALVGFDIYGSENVQLIADAHQIPFADGTFDAVVIQAVLEHVLEPSVVVAEIWRVLKPNGYVYAETPFLQNVHEGAYDFTRFTESGHRWLFRDFELISSGPGNGPAAQLIWSASYFFWGLTRTAHCGPQCAPLCRQWNYEHIQIRAEVTFCSLSL
jgi:SAM-dependent methyltransferase